ncbi:MAG: response regulator [Balneolales bacterium]
MSIKSILLVEDEYLIGINIYTTLSDAGYEVIGPAMNVQSAMQLIDKNNFDAAVLDVNLGGEFSTTIAARLSRLRIPYLLLSGYTREDLPDEVIDVPLVEKPFDDYILLETLSDFWVDNKIP